MLNIAVWESSLPLYKDMQMTNENNTTTKPYIVKNADGVEYLLPYYPATFRALLDDKDIMPILRFEANMITTGRNSSSLCPKKKRRSTIMSYLKQSPFGFADSRF